MVHVSRKTRRGCERLCKSWDEYRPCQPGPQAGRRGRGEPARFRTHGSLHMIPKTDGTIFGTHRQICRLVYTGSARSNLRVNPTQEAPYGHSRAAPWTGTENPEASEPSA